MADTRLDHLLRALPVDRIPDGPAPVPPDAEPWREAPDGRHLAAMGLELHPLLGRDPAVVAAVRSALVTAGLTLPPRSELAGNEPFRGVLYLRRGKARVLLREGCQRTELWRYRLGTWLGIPRLWAEWLRRTPGQTCPPELDELLGRLTFQLMEQPGREDEDFVFDVLPAEAGLALMDAHPLFRAFVESSVAVGLLRAQELAGLMRDHPVFGSLKEEDQAFLLQLGVLRRTGLDGRGPGGEPSVGTPYLDPRDPHTSRRVAMVLDGVAHQYTAPRRGHAPVFVGEARRGALIGVGGIVEPRDVRELDRAQRAFLAGQGAWFTEEDRDAIRRAPLGDHESLTWLGPGTEVLEWDRLVLRWVLSSRLDTWGPAVRYLGPGAITGAEDQARLTVVCGSKPGLGATTLALGTAAALARSAYDEALDRRIPDRVVWIVLVALRPEDVPRDDWLWALKDRQPERVRIRRFSVDADTRLEVPVTDLTVDARTAGLGEPGPAEARTLRVAWFEHLGNAEVAVNLLRAQPRVTDVVMVLHGTSHPTVRRAMEHLVGRTTPVVWLHDDPAHEDRLIEHALDREERGLVDVHPVDLPGLPAVLPAVLIRADRVDPAWIERARARSTLPHEADALVKRRMPYPWRHVLRVLDDPDTAASVRSLALDQALDAHESSPLSRSFWRLKRMIRGRTVGVALGGGGVFGCAHVALLEELTARGVPVDYVAGASFGALVSGLWAAGQHEVIAHYMCVNPDPPERLGIGPLASLWGAWHSATFRSVIPSVIYDTVAFERMVDRTVAASVPRPEAVLADCTEIPFMAVGVDIASRSIGVARSGSIGWAVRIGCCLPPVFPAILAGSHRFVDGAILANVPAEELRHTGADFVVACNVVPPVGTMEATVVGLDGHARHPEPPRVHRRTTALLRMVAGPTMPPVQTVSARVRDLLSAAWSVLWKVGMDQSLNTADVCVDIWTVDVSMGSFWWGQRVRDTTRVRLQALGIADQIHARWEDPSPAPGVLYRRVLPLDPP